MLLPKGGSCVPCNLAPTLLNRLDTMIVAYAPLGGDCGWTPPSNPPQGLFLSDTLGTQRSVRPAAWHRRYITNFCIPQVWYSTFLTAASPLPPT